MEGASYVPDNIAMYSWVQSWQAQSAELGIHADAELGNMSNACGRAMEARTQDPNSGPHSLVQVTAGMACSLALYASVQSWAPCKDP